MLFKVYLIWPNRVENTIHNTAKCCIIDFRLVFFLCCAKQLLDTKMWKIYVVLIFALYLTMEVTGAPSDDGLTKVTGSSDRGGRTRIKCWAFKPSDVSIDFTFDGVLVATCYRFGRSKTLHKVGKERTLNCGKVKFEKTYSYRLKISCA